MTPTSRPVIATAAQGVRGGWNDPVRGSLSWSTLFSRDSTPTDSLSAGIAEIAPGGSLKPHRHAHPEVYFIAEGVGIVTLDGRESAIAAGAAVFIPGDAEHGIRNDGAATLRFFYCFPADSFAEVVYRFPEN